MTTVHRYIDTQKEKRTGGAIQNDELIAWLQTVVDDAEQLYSDATFEWHPVKNLSGSLKNWNGAFVLLSALYSRGAIDRSEIDLVKRITSNTL